MFQNKCDTERRRGRPQIRPDGETRERIVEAADTCFKADGYSGASMGAIASLAGVSTKTMYRLFPGKSELLADVISRHISRFLIDIDFDLLRGMSPRESLVRLLSAYGMLTLSSEAIRMARLVVEESSRFPEVGIAFYEKAIVPTNVVISDWLREKQNQGELAIQDAEVASGILRGMMIMEPQRASLMLQQNPFDRSAIERRAAECVDQFLDGCSRERAA